MPNLEFTSPIVHFACSCLRGQIDLTSLTFSMQLLQGKGLSDIRCNVHEECSSQKVIEDHTITFSHNSPQTLGYESVTRIKIKGASYSRTLVLFTSQSSSQASGATSTFPCFRHFQPRSSGLQTPTYTYESGLEIIHRDPPVSSLTVAERS